MATYCALTVRKLKPGAYEDWRKAWWPENDQTPENAEVYIVRNLKDPDEIIAFGIIEGDIDAITSGFDEGEERKRQEDMAQYVESVGADGIYEVIERISTKEGARA